MTIICNKLDKRIKDISTIQTILRYDVNCIGCKGYFFDEFIQTKDLSKCRYGELIDITTHDDRNDLCFKSGYEEGLIGFFRFFISEADLKPAEKKYRPYKNPQEMFDDLGCYVGDIIYLRTKTKEEHHMMVVGYSDNTVTLGNDMFNFNQLFAEFELRSRGEWQPFGVEIQGEE